MSSTDSSAEKRITGTSERREQIIQRLRAQGSVQVNDLSLLFGVSTVTIRNDLAFLEKQGIAVRAYGGALICEGNAPGVEPPVKGESRSFSGCGRREACRLTIFLFYSVCRR